MSLDHALPDVVINADDLGLSTKVNEAIVSALSSGLASSATIMANMPGFDEACSSVLEHGLQDRIGVHLNLTEGAPLSEPIRQCPTLCGSDGQLSGHPRPLWRLSAVERRAIEVELTEQLEAVVRAGIVPSHLDSHHHVHTQWPIGVIVTRLALDHGIAAVRLSRNCGSRPTLATRVYKAIFNRRLARMGLARTRYFGSAVDASGLDPLAGPIEVMVHPTLDDAGEVIDITSGVARLEDIARSWRTRARIVSYRGLTEQTARREGNDTR